MIRLFRPVYNTERILSELRGVFDNGWTGLGRKTTLFEREFSQFVCSIFCTATNSCTSALHLAIKNLKLRSGAKVLTTPMTFVSTNHVLLYEGLIPVFCDIEKTTGNIDLDMAYDYSLKHKDIEAIIVVHFAGYPCDMDKLEMWPTPIIEDCAHALGASFKDCPIGSFGNICCWSFHSVKNLSIGDGGAITTDLGQDKLYFDSMRWMGIDKSTISRVGGSGYSWEYAINEIGHKYHMNDISATIALEQLKTLIMHNARRAEIAKKYRDNLKATFPNYKSNRESSYHFFPVLVDNRNEVIKALKANDIESGVHYKPNFLYPAYKSFFKINDCKNALWFYEHEITLPIGSHLSDCEIDKVISVFNKVAIPCQ